MSTAGALLWNELGARDGGSQRVKSRTQHQPRSGHVGATGARFKCQRDGTLEKALLERAAVQADVHVAPLLERAPLPVLFVNYQLPGLQGASLARWPWQGAGGRAGEPAGQLARELCAPTQAASPMAAGL